jgi:hypothetical protein
MEEKEKANELVERFYQNAPELFGTSKAMGYAEQCALICVDEILKECSNWAGGTNDGWDAKRFDYWNEVKKEIEKL